MKPILFLIFTIAVSSCLCMGTPEEPYLACYGVEFNSTRKVLGIPLLKEDWVATDSTKEKTVWRPMVKMEKPYHSSKVIRYYNGTLAWETDNYYSNKKYSTEDGTSVECLSIQFYYISSAYNKYLPDDAPEKGKVGFVCEYIHCHESGLFSARDLVTKPQADSLLISWGLGDEIVSIQTKK